MDVFISWSGVKSGDVARIIEKYLPALINDARPWLSSKDISVGARWSAEIASKLEATHTGIICLTAENQHEPWILFEAGAISKLTATSRAMVLRLNLAATDVVGPLSQFQGRDFNQEGIFDILMSVNSALGSRSVDEGTLKLAFDAFWPRIKVEFEDVMSRDSVVPPRRAEREMIEELLTIVRIGEQRQQFEMERLFSHMALLEERMPFAGSLGPYGSYISPFAGGGVINPYGSLTSPSAGAGASYQHGSTLLTSAVGSSSNWEPRIGGGGASSSTATKPSPPSNNPDSRGQKDDTGPQPIRAARSKGKPATQP